MEVDAAQRLMRLQQVLNLSPQFPVFAAGTVQEGRPQVRSLLDCGQEDRSGLIDMIIHGNLA
jgi:hypothetical protein